MCSERALWQFSLRVRRANGSCKGYPVLVLPTQELYSQWVVLFQGCTSVLKPFVVFRNCICKCQIVIERNMSVEWSCIFEFCTWCCFVGVIKQCSQFLFGTVWFLCHVTQNNPMYMQSSMNILLPSAFVYHHCNHSPEYRPLLLSQALNTAMRLKYGILLRWKIRLVWWIKQYKLENKTKVMSVFLSFATVFVLYLYFIVVLFFLLCLIGVQFWDHLSLPQFY